MKPFFKIGPTPASFLFIFGLFKQTIQFLQQINVKKCPSSIRRWDSNPRPLERESTPITTRPGLPPIYETLPRYLTEAWSHQDTWANLIVAKMIVEYRKYIEKCLGIYFSSSAAAAGSSHEMTQLHP